MTRWKHIAAVTVLSLYHLNAQAAIHCEGQVQYALLYSDGSVNVLGLWRGDYTVICNIHGTRGGVSAETCLTWYAAASKAAADAKTLAVYYDTNSYTCANLPTYGSGLTPVYVGLKRPSI